MSFDSFNFVKHKSRVFNDFESLVQTQQAFGSFVANETKVEDIIVNDDFSFDFNGLKYTPTRDAAISFCKALGIPRNYAQYIPNDLLMENIHRLVDENKSNKITLVIDAEGNRLVDVTKTKIKNLTLPARLLSNFPAKDNYKFSFAHVSDLGYHINFTDTNFEEFTIPKVNHISKAGVAILGTTTGFNTYAQAYIEQLICSNGMVAPRIMGYVRLMGGGGNDDKKLINFFHRIENQIHDLDFIKFSFNKMVENDMPDDRFAHFWNRTKKITDESEADITFGIDELLREEYIARAKVNGESDKPQENTQINYYDAYYKLTENAQRQSPVIQANLRQLAGQFLLDFKRN